VLFLLNANGPCFVEAQNLSGVKRQFCLNVVDLFATKLHAALFDKAARFGA
jgi:hypothetical protein